MRSLVLIVVVVTSAIASAAPADDVKAEALFADGQKLKAAGKLQESCAKFEEALHFNRNAVGTILNVALCDEQAGKVASAAKLFVEARDRAREQNLGEHYQAAVDHLGQIEASIPHLAIAFVEPPGPGTKLVVDDQVIDLAAASEIAIDPGTRTITVTAQGRLPYEIKVEIARNERKAIAIPNLAYPVTVKTARQTVGKVLLGIGVAAVVSSELLAFQAHRDYQSVIDAGGCPNLMCSPDDFTKTHDAHSLGNIATGVGIAGVAVAGVGVYLWFFAPRELQRTGVAFVPAIGPEQAGVAAVGRF